MDSKRAKKVIESEGYKVLKWNGDFTSATIKTKDGATVELNIRGGRAKIVERLKNVKPLAPPLAPL